MTKMHNHLLIGAIIIVAIIFVLYKLKKRSSKEGYWHGWRGGPLRWNRARAFARWENAHDTALLYYPWNSDYYYEPTNPVQEIYNNKVSQLPLAWEKIAEIVSTDGANSTNLVTRKDGSGVSVYGFQLLDESIAPLPNFVLGHKTVMINGEPWKVNYDSNLISDN